MMKEETHFVGQIAQKALIENMLGQILLVQYPEGDPAAGKWDLPGGRLNEGESALEGVKREVLEEIGSAIDVHGILAAEAVVINQTFKLYYVIYKASLSNPEQPLVAEEGEIAKVEWHNKADFFTLPFLNTQIAEVLREFLK